MQSAVRRPGGGRVLAALAAGVLIALALGLIAGRWPLIAVLLAAGTVVAILMLRNLAIGIVVFTLVSFAGILATSHGASASKGIGGLLALAWVATLSRRSERDLRTLFSEHRGLISCAVALLAWSLASAAWAQSSSTAVAGAGRWAQDLLLLPIVYTGLTRMKDIRWMVAAFVGGALLAVVYGIATGTTGSYSRLASALDDPEETAAVLVAAATLALALGATAGTRLRRTGGYAAAVAAVLGLAATGSRGGLVALGAALIAAIFLAGRWRRQVATVAVVGVVIVLGWFLLLAPAATTGHISNLQTGRTTLWTVASRAIASSPIIGVGGDNFAVVSSQYIVRPGVTNDALQVVIDPKVAHNIFLELWADLGIVGLLLFSALVLASLRCALLAVRAFEWAGRRSEEILARALIVAVVAMLAADFFMSDLYSKQFFLLLALGPAMLALARRRTEPEVDPLAFAHTPPNLS